MKYDNDSRNRVFSLGLSEMHPDEIASSIIRAENLTFIGEVYDKVHGRRYDDVISELPKNRYYVDGTIEDDQPLIDAYMEDGNISHLSPMLELSSRHAEIFETARSYGVKAIAGELGGEKIKGLIELNPEISDRIKQKHVDLYGSEYAFAVAISPERGVYMAQKIMNIENYHEVPILTRCAAGIVPIIVDTIFLNPSEKDYKYIQ